MKKKPNIILFFIDDMGWKDVGFMGSTYYETPHIDRLAAKGTIFTNAYANAPNCAPSRACLMSGKYTPRHGIYTVGSSERGPEHLRKLIPIPNKEVLGLEHKTIAEVLKEAGYTCGHVGKWHLGEGEITGPEGRGFSFNAGGIHKGHPPAGYFSPYQISTLPDGPENEYLTDRLTDEAIRFIHEQKDRPFFLYFAHYAVHTPIQAKGEIVDKYKRKQPSQGQDNPVYAAMIESTDQSVGKIMNTLDELGLSEHTIVLFFSDNGGLGGYKEHGLYAREVTSQAPLRGGKGMMYEGGIRVPMFIYWPSHGKAGAVCEEPVSGVDFFPTILDWAGLKRKQDQILDGESLVPLLTGQEKLQRDAIFWHMPVYLEGGKGTWRTTPAGAVRKGDWKLIEFFEDGKLELYHLKEDIEEKHNLAESRPDKVAELLTTMQQWRDTVHAPVPIKKNPKYAANRNRNERF